MKDKARIPHTPGTLPAFTPLPRQTNRHDGWTAERQQQFIEALADLGSVKAAAHAVNMTAEGAYQLRRHPQAATFRKAWQSALALGIRRLEDVAMERALYGVEVPVYHFGAVVGTRRVFNDRLLMFLLRNRAPKRFAADAATRAMLDRYKKAWRAEWQAEADARSAAEAEQAVTSLNEKLELMARRAAALAQTPPSPDPQPEPDPLGERPPRPPWVKPPKPLAPLPKPYNNPQTDNERVIAAWMRHVEAGRIGRKVNEEARLNAEALAGLRAVEEGEEESIIKNAT